MTLLDLQKIVDFYSNRRDTNYKPENVSVVITLSETSIGGRAKVNVESCFMGFDWENNQFRIEPSEELVRRGNSLTDIKSVRHRESFDKSCMIYACPSCGCKIAKQDKYCRYCGQRLK